MNKEQREIMRNRVLAALTAEADRQRLLEGAEGKVRFTMEKRQQIADECGCNIGLIHTMIKEQKLGNYKQWTQDELRDIWVNYEELGPKKLAERYGVTNRVIIQQIYVMRRAEASEPWIR